MKKLMLSACAVALLAGCTANPYNIRPASSEQRRVIDKNYVLGEEKVTYVGQPVVRFKDYYGTPAQIFTSPVAFTAKLRDVVVQYPSGTQAQAASLLDHEGVTYFAAGVNPPMPSGAALLIEKSGRFGGLAYTHEDEVFEACDDREYVCVTPAAIEFTPSTTDVVTRTEGFVNFEIIYSGATKDAMHLLYREYAPGDLARPAYTQNLTYDRASPVLRFREIQIRVIEANNESLRVIVEADGSAQ